MASAFDHITVRFSDAEVRAQLERIAAELGILDDHAQLEALIPAMRQSAQDTLAALHRRGFRIVHAGEDKNAANDGKGRGE
jgi:hypothetical protein